MPLSIAILAAGQGTRMLSDRPKVLHRLAGRPMLEHVVDCANALNASRIFVVIGCGAEQVKAALTGAEVAWVLQEQQLGTGHAVAQAMPEIPDEDTLLILYGDVPLLRAETLSPLVAAAEGGALALLSVELEDPTGYGRVLRDAQGRVTAIVEEKDATPAQRRLTETNTGVLACRAGVLKPWLAALENDNAQGEYYLTDVVALAVRDGVRVQATAAADSAEVAGINDMEQLAAGEAAYRQRRAKELMRQGVTLADPARIDIRGAVVTGRDVFIDVNAVLEGEVKLGDRVQVGPGVVIRDAEIGDDTRVEAHCVIDTAHIGPRCSIGPFARIRPATYLGSEVRIGNFVETKKSTIARGSKVNHLTYIGDATIGEGVNVGAGTITCNYDGANKHETVIEDNAFIGSGTQLVAPVKVGAGATIGAGSVISRDAPADELTVARGQQTVVPGWRRPVKKKPLES